MKMRIFTLMLLVAGFAFTSYATNPISPEAIDFEKTIKVDKKMNKMAKRLAKFSQTKVGKWVVKKASKVAKYLQAVDLQDPVQKWLWYAIFLLIGAVVVSILGYFIPFIWYISYLVWLAGVVCFWYWVYLKFLQ